MSALDAALRRDRPSTREEFLAFMAKRYNWTRGAELGLWYGRTFFHLLKNCPNLHMIGVDVFDPQPDNTDLTDWSMFNHEENEQIIMDGIKPFEPRATVIKAYTHDAVKQIEDSTLDFVFIDADHSSEAVRQDILDWSPKVKDTGWITGHDIDWPTVKSVVDELVPGYKTGPDNVWYRTKKV